MMALMFIMSLMATNWELFKSKSKSKRNLELLDLLASPQVKTYLLKVSYFQVLFRNGDTTISNLKSSQQLALTPSIEDQ